MRSALAANLASIAAMRAFAMGGGAPMGDLHADERYDADEDDVEIGGGDGVDRDEESSCRYESAGDGVVLSRSGWMGVLLLLSFSPSGAIFATVEARRALKSTTGRSTTLAWALGIRCAAAPAFARARAPLR